MDHYFDITIKSKRLKTTTLLNDVYTEFHRLLCRLQASDVGVSFPEQDVTLGSIMRIHSSAERLSEVKHANWPSDLIEHCTIGDVESTPQDCEHRQLLRKRPSKSLSKLRRAIRRGSIGPDQMKDYIGKMLKGAITEPFMQLKSATTGKIHRRHIALSEPSSIPVAGEFDSFGMSKGATVPWF